MQFLTPAPNFRGSIDLHPAFPNPCFCLYTLFCHPGYQVFST